jgi:very-short-patch-repair endonuclease
MDKVVPDAHGRPSRTKFRGAWRFKPLLERARAMRREPTDAERLLWSRLRNRRLDGLKFRGRHPFGGCILDFFCEEAALAVEADGGHDYSDEGVEGDAGRTAFLERAGVRVLRFSDREILTEFPLVLEAIFDAARQRPSPQPSPGGRGSSDAL